MSLNKKGFLLIDALLSLTVITLIVSITLSLSNLENNRKNIENELIITMESMYEEIVSK